jgi:RimJ/RimL family protein N-acetyltransferase
MRLREIEAEREAPFVTIQREGGAVLGSTRYMTLRPEHRGVEIGNTWLAQSAWSTGTNVEAKLLMLEHAFERVGAMRVEFKTDARNVESRRALEALPATFEGILRKHMLIHAGIRDSGLLRDHGRRLARGEDEPRTPPPGPPLASAQCRAATSSTKSECASATSIRWGT